MQTPRKCKPETLEKILDDFFHYREVPRKCWIAQEEDGSWTAIDNTTDDCWTENFETEFAARYRAETTEDAEYIR